MTTEELSTIRGRIRYSRLRLGWTQTQLASAYAGRPASCVTVSLWESGKSTPRNFPQLAEILGVRIDWLLAGTGQVTEQAES